MIAMSGLLDWLRSLRSRRNDSRYKHSVKRIPLDDVGLQRRSVMIGLHGAPDTASVSR